VTRPIAAAGVLAAALAVGANQPGSSSEPFATGRERSPEDHEFYRTAEPPSSRAIPMPTGGGSRFLPPTGAGDWVRIARRWAAHLGLPVYER
jgi:hypothetical protein